MNKNYLIGLLLFVGSMSQVSFAQVQLGVGDVTLGCQTGTVITVPFTMANATNITACQFTVEWDETLLKFIPDSAKLQGVFGSPSFSPNFGQAQINNGLLTFAWIDNPGVNAVSQTTIFTAKFTVLSAAASSIVINGSLTPIKVGQGGPPVISQQVVVSSGDITTGDIEAPILVCPADQTISSDNPLPINSLTPFVSDNCNLQSLIYTLSAATIASDSGDASGQNVFNLGDTYLTYIAEDSNGNIATCQSVITVTQDILTVIAQSNTPQCGESFFIDILVDHFDEVSTLGFTLNFDPTLLKFDSTGLYENQFIGVQNSDIGTFAANNGNITFAWYDAANKNAIDGTRLFRIYFTTIGGSGSNSAISFTSTITPQLAGTGAPSPTQIPAIWENGAVQIIDLTAPTIVCPSNQNFENVPANQLPLAISGLYPTANDNCGVTSVSYQLTNATVGAGQMPFNGTLNFNEGITNVTQTAFDAAGNSTSCTFSVTVTGATKPKFLLPTLTVECGTKQAIISITGNDLINVSSLGLMVGFNNTVLSIDSIGGFNPVFGAPTNWVYNDLNGQLLIGWDNSPINTGVSVPSGEIILKIYAKIIGTAGDVSTLTFDAPPVATSPSNTNYPTTSQNGLLNIVDTAPPVFTNCPTDFAIDANTDCQGILMYNPPTIIDNCIGTNFILSSNISIGDTLELGATQIIIRANDQFANQSTCTFTVVVIDNTPPTIMCPNNDTLALDSGNCSVTINSYPQPISVLDNCSTTLVLAGPSPILPLILLPNQSVNLFYTVVDEAGLATVCNFFLTAEPETLPSVVTCPPNQTIDCIDLDTYSLPIPTFSQGCGSNLSYSNFPTDTANLVFGTTNYQFFAVNDAGDSAKCAFNITINDTEKPTFTCPSDKTINAVGGCPVIMPDFQVVPNDNCDDVVDVNYLPSPGSVLNVGITNVQVTVTDDSGNADTCYFKIFVQSDQAAGFFNCPKDSVYQNVCTVAPIWATPLPVGFCGTPTVTFSQTGSSPLFAGQSNTITYLAVDGNGNSATCTFTVSATENLPPMLSCPSDIIINVGGAIVSDSTGYLTDADPAAGCTAVNLSFNAPSATDLCGNVSLVQTGGIVSGGAFPIDTNFLFWRAIDASGNFSTCSFSITVVPIDTPIIISTPTLACLGDKIILTTNSNAPGTTYSWTGPGGFTANTSSAEIPLLTSATAEFYFVKISINGCPAPLSNAFSVNLSKKPTAVNDNFIVDIGQKLDSINLLNNDLLTLGDTYSLATLGNPSSGVLTNLTNGFFNYTAPGTAVGGVNFAYKICSETCPTLCDTGFVTIVVQENTTDCLKIPKVITPNGDGNNDFWLIFCIETGLFPNNELNVYNQWGDKVYEAAPYKNNWTGTLFENTGKDLPDGTYFYVFKPSPIAPPVKGFLTIFR